MSSPDESHFTVFTGHERIARGNLSTVARAAHADRDQALLVFDDATGRPVDLDLRGSLAETLARISPKPARGRPKLGVTAREVTLLPRHWDWLATQSGGASAALRRLVDQARKDTAGVASARQAQETGHRVMTALAGDLPNYEEALRAVYAKDPARFGALIADWPPDVRDYVLQLTAPVFASPT